MSNQQSTSTSSSYTFSSFSSSSSTTRDGVQEVSGSRHAQSSVTDRDGNTRTVTEEQRLGEPAVRTERTTDGSGREMVGDGGSGGRARIEDVSDGEQAERDRLYEERMEEEYAKREGGA